MRNKCIPALLFLVISAGGARGQPELAIGVYGGLNAPVVQQDIRSGPGFGAKFTIIPASLLAIAGFYERREFGDPTRRVFRGTPLERTIVMDGGSADVAGAQVMIGDFGRETGPRFYWMFGIGNYHWARDNFPELDGVFYHAGLGLEMAIPGNFGIDASVKLEVVPTDGGGSRKNFLALVGANYHFDL